MPTNIYPGNMTVTLSNLLYSTCALSPSMKVVSLFGRIESSMSNTNLNVCGREISNRSLSPTLQLASKRWRYPGSVLEVGNEYTLGINMGN